MAGEIGEKIKKLRKAQGITQSDLADRSGVSFRAIQNIETGNRTPRSDTLEMIAQALGVNPGELLAGGESAAATRLSAAAISGPLSIHDGAAILVELANISPERRAMALAIIFDDSSLAPDLGSSGVPPVAAKPG